jgi:HlyD family secretion protein
MTVVPNGVQVQKGEAILQIDALRIFRQVREQSVQYQQAQEDLEARKQRLSGGVAKARIALERVEKELEQFRAQQTAQLAESRAERDQNAETLALARERLERKRRLADEALVPQREVELATADIKAKEFTVERLTKQLEVAEARKASGELDKVAAVSKAQADLARAESEQQSELRSASITLRIREQQLKRVQEQLEKATIIAPDTGIVILAEVQDGASRRPLQPGDQIWQGRQVATLPDLRKMRAGAEVAQAAARMVRAGQRAVITVDAIPGVEFTGKVTEISQTASENSNRMGMPNSERTFRSLIEIDSTKGQPLRPGMTAQVRIIVEKIPEAVHVPLECVFERGGRKLVYVRGANGFRAVEVRLGSANAERVVITKGLSGGEEVALNDLGKRGPESDESTPPDTSPLMER